MPDENDLRDLLRREPDRGPASLDVDRIVRRARARRLPRQLAAGAVGSLAVVAIVVPVSLGAGSLVLPSTSGGAADEAPLSAEDSSLGAGTGPGSEALAPAQRLQLCAAPLVEPAPDAGGLVLEIAPLAPADADAAWIEATVTLTNTGTVPVSGTTGAAPVLALAEDGTVLWHGNGPTTMIAVLVDLAPGESMEYEAGFAPLRCGPEDDASDLGFREDLPAAGPGEYTLQAAIDLVPNDGGATRLVTGPATPVTLR